MSEEHASWFEQVAAYSLGALEPGEAAALEAHLAECEPCQARLQWLAPAVAALPEDVQRLEPPPALRERVMAEVREDASNARVAEPVAEGFRRRGWLAWLRSGAHGFKPAIALAAIALVAVAFAGYELGTSDSGGSPPLTEVTQEEASGVKVQMVSDGAGGTLKLEDVEPLPGDRVLEAWVQRDGQVEPVPALFVPNDEGRAWTVIEDLSGVEAVMVTHEPKGGSQTPTSDPIVTVELG